MKKSQSQLEREFLALARHSLEKHNLPRITRCLKILSEEELWWRPHSASNSVGNLLLHLSGNVRQWILTGLGGEPDRRQRDKEFSETGPLSSRKLLALLRETVRKAGRVIAGLSARQLARKYTVQGFRVTGIQAVSHVVEHFAYHTGQIVFVTKLKRGQDLGFTRLAGEKRPAARGLPSL